MMLASSIIKAERLQHNANLGQISSVNLAQNVAKDSQVVHALTFVQKSLFVNLEDLSLELRAKLNGSSTAAPSRGTGTAIVAQGAAAESGPAAEPKAKRPRTKL